MIVRTDGRFSFVLGGVALALVVLLSTAGAQAEFFVWHDRDGRKHVSTIPARGFARDGGVYRGHDPNSIVYQHRRMLTRLENRQVEIAAAAEAARREALVEAPPQTRPPPSRRAPREGVMNLDELIALEKRGGRFQQAPPPDQGVATDRSK